MSAVIGKVTIVGFYVSYRNNKEERGKTETQNTRTWVSATLDLLINAFLLALSHSGRHERTTVCTLLLCAGPIEGCFAVLAARRYYSGFRILVCAFVVCAEEKKQVKKTKTSSLFVFLGASRADDTSSFDSVSPRRAPPQKSCSPRGWYSPVP